MFEEFICMRFTSLKLAVYKTNTFFLDGLSSSELSESDSPVFLYRIVNLTVISFLFSSIQRSIPRSTFTQQKLSSSAVMDLGRVEAGFDLGTDPTDLTTKTG